ncbi:MAG: ATP-binding protein [Ilumatobacteraceae bacterium]
MERPADLFDRTTEWSVLRSFVESDRPGATLALVYGRRRQGKTYLLDAMSTACEGFFFSALAQSRTQNLARLADHYRAFAGIGAPVHFSDWDEALRSVMALGEGAERPVPVVIDELPYLLADSPELPSLLQELLRPRSAAATRWRTRLVLCGSALSVMRGLLTGSAPLRGRASAELMVHPFEFREAAEFWGARDLDVAVRLHALVGGTPAYRDMAAASGPPPARSFDEWVVRHLLHPSSAMYREGHVLLAEEDRITDTSLYFAVLAAIASGRSRRSEIAQAIGRADAAIAHPLAVLTEARFVEASDDPLRQRRTSFRLAEPILRLHQLVVAPNTRLLDRGRGTDVWDAHQDTVSARIYGPHFEGLARKWAADHASQESLGGFANKVGSSTVSCRAHRVTHELDVVCVESVPQQPSRIIALGEAKWSSSLVGVDVLHRLEHARELLPDAEHARLLVFARRGFDAELRRAAAARNDVELVDLERLYSGT